MRTDVVRGMILVIYACTSAICLKQNENCPVQEEEKKTQGVKYDELFHE